LKLPSHPADEGNRVLPEEIAASEVENDFIVFVLYVRPGLKEPPESPKIVIQPRDADRHHMKMVSQFATKSFGEKGGREGSQIGFRLHL
jgi:hypothetical protein